VPGGRGPHFHPACDAAITFEILNWAVSVPTGFQSVAAPRIQPLSASALDFRAASISPASAGRVRLDFSQLKEGDSRASSRGSLSIALGAQQKKGHYVENHFLACLGRRGDCHRRRPYDDF